MNIKDLKIKVKKLQERKERISAFISRNENKSDLIDLVNISKGQVIELIGWISYILGLINDLKGE